MEDPLSLNNTPPANEKRLANATPHPAVESLYRRLTTSHSADSMEIRTVLLAQLIYIAYRDLKESIHL